MILSEPRPMLFACKKIEEKNITWRQTSQDIFWRESSKNFTKQKSHSFKLFLPKKIKKSYSISNTMFWLFFTLFGKRSHLWRHSNVLFWPKNKLKWVKILKTLLVKWCNQCHSQKKFFRLKREESYIAISTCLKTI